jgi:hypothetical protein
METMSEAPRNKAVKGEALRGNRVYRLIKTGPVFGGLPILQTGILGVSITLGFWVVKMIFGGLGGVIWVLTGACIWGALVYLRNQDEMFLPILWLRLSGVVMKDNITSYVRSSQRIKVK